MVVLAGLERIRAEVSKSALSVAAKSDLLARLEEKSEQAETALNEALHITLEATTVSRVDANGTPVKEVLKKEADAMTTVSPGQEFLAAVDFHNGSKQSLVMNSIKLEVPEGWATISDKTKRFSVQPGQDARVVFRLKVPKNAEYTRPYWHRDNPDTDSLNHVDNEKYATLPFPPPVLRARADYSVAGANGAA